MQRTWNTHPSASPRGLRLLALLASAGLALPAAAQDWHWSAAVDGHWSNPMNWLPNGLPPESAHVFMGSLEGVESDTLTLDMSDTIAGLTITDGIMLWTDVRTLQINGDLSISGANTVDYGDYTVYYPSSLTLNHVDGVTLRVVDVGLADEGRLNFETGAYADIYGTANNGATSGIAGDGVIRLHAAGTNLINDGRISPQTGAGLHFQQLNGGLYDLDGAFGAGRIGMALYNTVEDRGPSLRFDGTGLSDSFGGEITIGSDSDLYMNLSDGWTADAGSVIKMYGFYEEPNQPGFIRGGAFDFGGEMEVTGGEYGHLKIESSTFRILPTALITLKPDTQADFGATGTQVIVDGGALNVQEGAELRFNAPTTWRGQVLSTGVVRQMKTATVSTASTIDAEVLDMDGSNSTTWNINAWLVINAEEIDTGLFPTFDGTINIAGGFLPRLTLNITDPGQGWAMNGEMNFAGDNAFVINRVAGSPMHVTGDLNVTGGKAGVTADLLMAQFSHVDIASASTELHVAGKTTVAAGATLTGHGTLVNTTSGRLVLEDQATLGPIELENRGLLQIGQGTPGAATVPGLVSSPDAEWQVDVGGFGPGDEHDALTVNGDIHLDGRLEVELIDAGGGLFLPQVGDAFNIVSATGMISGEFVNDPVSFGGGNIYKWRVVPGIQRMTIQVDQIVVCVGDFNDDGVINTIDFIEFLNAWAQGAKRADLNGDGLVNTQDAIAFLDFWANGC